MQETRKVQDINDTMAINIPKYMAKALDINKGDRLEITLKLNKQQIIINKEEK